MKSSPNDLMAALRKAYDDCDYVLHILHTLGDGRVNCQEGFCCLLPAMNFTSATLRSIGRAIDAAKHLEQRTSAEGSNRSEERS